MAEKELDTPPKEGDWKNEVADAEFQKLLSQWKTEGERKPEPIATKTAPPAKPAAPLAAPAPTTEPPDPFVERMKQQLDFLGAELNARRQSLEGADTKSLATREALLPPAIAKVEQAAREPKPPLPQMMPEPPVPSKAAKPFLTPETGQALQSVVAGLGLLVTSLVGMKAPRAALSAVTGAMTGWAEGDADRTAREWQHYEALVAKMSRENETATKAWERQRVVWGDDQEAAQINLQAQMLKAQLPEYAAMVAEKGYGRVHQDFQLAATLLNHMQTQTNALIGKKIQLMREENLQTRRAVLQTQAENKLALERARVAQGERRTTAYEELTKGAGKAAKDLDKVDSDLVTTAEKERLIRQVQAAVERLHAKGAIPKGGTFQEIQMKKLARNALLANDPQTAADIQDIKSWATALVTGKEIELQYGKVAALRFKDIAQAEVGNLLDRNKVWWDQALKPMVDFQRQRFKSLRERQSSLRAKVGAPIGSPYGKEDADADVQAGQELIEEHGIEFEEVTP